MDFDKDLAARQEARLLCRQAQNAQTKLRAMSQAQLDAITQAIAAAFEQAAGELAEMAVRDTGFGNAADKKTKNIFASRTVLEAIRDMKTVGILRRHPEKKLWEVGVPVGVIAAIVPSTNPTSTICYKALIAPPLESMYGLDAALKASDVKLCKLYAPPSETNFGGALLTGSRSACAAACDAFAAAVAEVAGNPYK